MIRVTIELVPGGHEEGKRVVGLVEIARSRLLPGNYGEYVVTLKKTPPFTGALRAMWRSGRLSVEEEVDPEALPEEDEEALVARVGGYHRTRRGVYDLLFMALRACGLEGRNRC
jgi:hypothetical protein